MGQAKWEIDSAHSSVNFWVRHMMVSRVHGRFAKWSAELELDERDLTRSKVTVEIDAASIDTKEPKRDDHLRSSDFLDVAKHPLITFRSRSVKPSGEARFDVVGDLTIGGVSRPVVLEVEYAGRAKDPWGGERAGFSAKVAIDRKEFGLAWNQVLETGGILVGDKIAIEIEVEAVRAKEVEAQPTEARAPLA